MLTVPPENEWLRPASLAGGACQRRFARLLYLDRSRPPGAADVAEREEMQLIDPDLFRRFIDACAKSERAATRTVPFR